jgi:colanic acid/amylovoran biosynthesis protein
MDSTKRIILLGAGFSTPNMGVSALTSGAVAAAIHSFSSAEISLFDYASEPALFEVIHAGGKAKVNLINIRFSKKYFGKNNIARLMLGAAMLKIVPLNRAKEKVIKRNPWLRAIADADVIGSIAGGDSFSDIYGFSRLIYIALPQILVLIMGKPLILLPQTLGPFNGRLAKTIASFIMKRSKVIYSRDLEGLRVGKELLKEDHNKVMFSYDLGFVLEPKIAENRLPGFLLKKDCTIPLVGLNVSGLLHIGGYNNNNMFELKSDYRILLNKIIEYFVKIHRAQILLVPHVFGTIESDVAASRTIFRESEKEIWKSLHIVEQEYDQYELKAIIGRCDFFIGSRMHACIAALSQSVPAVGLAYSRKFRGVFDSIGMERLVVDLREHDQSAILALVDQLYLNRKEVQRQLKAMMSGVKMSVLNLFNRKLGGDRYN